ncbi:C-type lectin domain family 10 member A-like isoform X1 [Anabas testudineus]|nr:C-type lectin domain family 10 member A-like isoform X1 [Anabas testudineus]XP_033182266.1 C-type lectin domain family 10 member A-like isoform X1 [Anabas testudineus]
MAEGEVNYAAVVFKSRNPPQAVVKKEEDVVYDEVKGQTKTTQQTADTHVSAGFVPDTKSNDKGHHCQPLTCCLGILCVILLLGIIAVSVYFTLRHGSDVSELKALMAENHNLTNISSKLLSDNENLKTDNNNLTNISSKLLSDNENLKTDNNNLTNQFEKLTQNYTVLVRNITDLTEKKQQLETQNQQLETQNQQLETQRNNLTQQIQNMETKWNEQNISRAQWTIDTYCPKGSNERQCKACPKGWENFQTSCFAINNAEAPKQRTWEGAREDCRGRNSDLAVIDNEAQKTFITGKSWTESGINGYWIGLRGENGRWKWINGSFLTESSWVQQPPTNNNSCAASLQNLNPWKSMDCDVKNAWICGQQALTV